jgi:hypothetical protein
VVLCTFSPARAWRPAVVARLARTLGHTGTVERGLQQGNTLPQRSDSPAHLEKPMPRFTYPFPSLLLALFCTVSIAQDGVVSGKEIEEKWVGKEMAGTSANGVKAFMKFEADRKVSITAGTFSDTGAWRPWESGYCTTWTALRAGQERCFTVTRSGSNLKVTNPDGSLSGYFANPK